MAIIGKRAHRPDTREVIPGRPQSSNRYAARSFRTKYQFSNVRSVAFPVHGHANAAELFGKSYAVRPMGRR